MCYIDQHWYRESPNQKNESSQNWWQHQQQHDEERFSEADDSKWKAILLKGYGAPFRAFGLTTFTIPPP